MKSEIMKKSRSKIKIETKIGIGIRIRTQSFHSFGLPPRR
jgi:hypothetical protein